MSDSFPINLFLDEDLVDELWTMLKRDGIPVERVKEASLKVAGKTKFGLGKLWEWVTADMTAEISAEGGGKYSEKLQYTAMLRAMLLRELIPSITVIGSDNIEEISDLRQDAFVQIACGKVELIPLPTYAGFLRQYALHWLGKAAEEENEDRHDTNSAIAYLEKYTVSERALTFVGRLVDDESASPGLKRLWENTQTVLTNALSMSNNDHVLALASLSEIEPEVHIYAVLKESDLRRNLGAFSGSRSLLFFGQIATINDDGAGHFQLGIMPISVSLG